MPFARELEPPVREPHDRPESEQREREELEDARERTARRKRAQAGGCAQQGRIVE
jgi:hypothetical protein